MKKKVIKPKHGTREYIESLCGILGSGGNAAEQLLKDRRKDDARQMKKFERFFKTYTNSDINHNKSGTGEI